MINKKTRQAISIAEYALFVAVLSISFIAMNTYMRRSVCGLIRTYADSLGRGRLYEPGETRVSYSTEQDNNTGGLCDNYDPAWCQDKFRCDYHCCGMCR